MAKVTCTPLPLAGQLAILETNKYCLGTSEYLLRKCQTLQVRELTAQVTKRDEEMEVMMRTVSHLISENSALKAAGQK